jgi:urease accessory protein
LRLSRPGPEREFGVQARAAVSVVRGEDGRDRLAVLRSEPPLTLRPSAGERAGGPGRSSARACVHLVGTSAGPLAGDELRLDVGVGDGAALTVQSSAATLVQPGARPGVSRLHVEVDVARGGSLEWMPEPTVLVRGSDHEVHVHLALEAGASVVWRDETVLGRFGEPPGSLLARLTVDRAGMPLLRNDLAVGPRWPGSQGPAGVGADTRAVGAVLVVGPRAPAVAAGGEPVAGSRAAVLPLAPDAVLVAAVAHTPGALRAALDALI